MIDADNAPAAKIEFIIAELATYGAVNIRRAYGNWKKSELSEWEKVLHEYAIQPVQHFDLVKGKNATDMALVIGAMDILYTKSIGTFGIVSSDCDFTPLVVRLKEEGKRVIGFGGQKTPAPFANSCTRFLVLDENPKAREVRQKKAANPQELKGDTKLMISCERPWRPRRTKRAGRCSGPAARTSRIRARSTLATTASAS
ncbi:MAG: NYN domain-containing protein [Chthoniobacteraceae bacterium]